MSDSAIDLMREQHSVLYEPDLVDHPERLSTQLQAARGLIVRNRTQVRAALLDAAPQLTVVGRLGVGLDNIDLEACKQRNVTVYPATGANTDAVAEYVVMATLMLIRVAWHQVPAVFNGDWPRQQAIGREVSGLTIGLIGCGAIASAVATRAEALGMNVIGYDPVLSEGASIWQLIDRVSELPTLLNSADCVSLHVPLTDETRHLISHSELALMKEGSVLINTARGDVVDERALAEALQAGQLGGAALDVYSIEPATASSLEPLSDFPNVLCTPHIAGVTEQSNERVSDLTARNVLAALAS